MFMLRLILCALPIGVMIEQVACWPPGAVARRAANAMGHCIQRPLDISCRTGRRLIMKIPAYRAGTLLFGSVE